MAKMCNRTIIVVVVLSLYDGKKKTIIAFILKVLVNAESLIQPVSNDHVMEESVLAPVADEIVLPFGPEVFYPDQMLNIPEA